MTPISTYHAVKKGLFLIIKHTLFGLFMTVKQTFESRITIIGHTLKTNKENSALAATPTSSLADIQQTFKNMQACPSFTLNKYSRTKNLFWRDDTPLIFWYLGRV